MCPRRRWGRRRRRRRTRVRAVRGAGEIVRRADHGVGFLPGRRSARRLSEDRAVSVHVVSRPGKDGEVRWLPSRVRRCKPPRGDSAADWSPDSATLYERRAAREIIHFDARTGRQAIGDFRDAEWREWTSPVGFQAMGVFQNGGLAGHEVNTACRAGVCAITRRGGRFGRVRVLRWPCVAPNAPAAEQTEAHANHVSCVRFSPDEGGNAWLVSTGGKDRGALQWRVAGGTETDEETLEGGDAGSPASRTTAAAASQAAIVDGIVPAEDEEVYEHEEEEEDAGGGGVFDGAAVARRRTGSSRALAYRKTRLAELDAKMSALLSAARPTPPPRRERPWARRPSVPPRGGRRARARRRPSRNRRRPSGRANGWSTSTASIDGRTRRGRTNARVGVRARDDAARARGAARTAVAPPVVFVHVSRHWLLLLLLGGRSRSAAEERGVLRRVPRGGGLSLGRRALERRRRAPPRRCRCRCRCRRPRGRPPPTRPVDRHRRSRVPRGVSRATTRSPRAAPPTRPRPRPPRPRDAATARWPSRVSSARPPSAAPPCCAAGISPRDPGAPVAPVDPHPHPLRAVPRVPVQVAPSFPSQPFTTSNATPFAYTSTSSPSPPPASAAVPIVLARANVKDDGRRRSKTSSRWLLMKCDTSSSANSILRRVTTGSSLSPPSTPDVPLLRGLRRRLPPPPTSPLLVFPSVLLLEPQASVLVHGQPLRRAERTFRPERSRDPRPSDSTASIAAARSAGDRTCASASTLAAAFETHRANSPAVSSVEKSSSSRRRASLATHHNAAAVAPASNRSFRTAARVARARTAVDIGVEFARALVANDHNNPLDTLGRSRASPRLAATSRATAFHHAADVASRSRSRSKS